MRYLQRPSTRHALVASALWMAVGCGTRVGNPKKPDEGTKQTVVMPKLSLDLPEKSTGTDLVQGPLKDVSNSGEGIRRLDIIVASLNDLIDNLNSTEITLGEVYGRDVAKGALVAQVIELPETTDAATYKYQGVFCANNKPFYYARWNEGGSEIHTVRDFGVNLFTDNDSSAEAGSDLMVEVVYRDSGKVIDSSLNGLPKVPDFVKAEFTYLMDFFRIEQGEDFLFKGVSFWSGPNDDRTTIAPQTYIAGKIEQDGLLHVLGQDSRLKNLCGEFDPAAPDSANWCFGYYRYAPDGPVSLYIKDETESLWGEIKTIGVAAPSDVKVVSFPAEAVCPTP